MAKKSGGGKLILIALVALVAGAAGFGYLNQTSKLSGEETAPAKLEQALLAPKPNDIIIGDINALATLVEYSSLSCPHCAHFHEKVLPTIEKEFISTGKVKLVLRHFPLNEPALRGAQIVECAGNNGLKRDSFAKVLFSMQSQWAFNEGSFLKDLKQIALVGGIDSATFDSCIADKELETGLLTARKEAEEKLAITGTPAFFLNGEKFQGEPSVENFRKALQDATAEAK